MKITFPAVNLRFNNTYVNQNKKQNVQNPILSQIKTDTVSFSSKNVSADLTFADMQNKIEFLSKIDYPARHDDATPRRKAILNEWVKYITDDTLSELTVPVQYEVLNSITKDLSRLNDNMPPVFNKEIFAETIKELDNDSSIDFKDIYNEKLKATYFIDKHTNEPITGWVEIPSTKKDPQNEEENINQLNALADANWDINLKTSNARSYLKNGDCHLYLENGVPKVCIQFNDDVVTKIISGNEDKKISLKYLDTIYNHISEGQYSSDQNTSYQLFVAKKLQAETNKIKADLKDAIKNNDSAQIFNYFGVETKTYKDGKISIAYFKQPSMNFTYEDLDIDENELLKDVVKIEGDAYFYNSKISSVKSLRTIGGNADFAGRTNIDLSSLNKISGNASFAVCDNVNLKNLKFIGGHASFRNVLNADLSKLEIVEGNATFTDSHISDLANLKSVEGNLDVENSKVNNLDSIEFIDGDANFRYTSITSMPNLKTIGGNADFDKSKIESLPLLETIGGEADFANSPIQDLSTLRDIGKDACFYMTSIKKLPSLKYIGNNADFRESQITSIPNIETIGKDAIFENTPINNLKKLKSIKGSGSFNNTTITELPSLETVERDIEMQNSQITDLSSLRRVKGNIYIKNAQLTSDYFKDIDIRGKINK